mmetsp:Transcript_10698/g.24990  ORF Transcript_10698/g.24990 Transcript_10698/m.24990 type:complete len:117 (+) Transcript_10698:487-837(+)
MAGGVVAPTTEAAAAEVLAGGVGGGAWLLAVSLAASFAASLAASLAVSLAAAGGFPRGGGRAAARRGDPERLDVGRVGRALVAPGGLGKLDAAEEHLVRQVSAHPGTPAEQSGPAT